MVDISPLFAVEAENLLKEGKYEEAVRLCQKGLGEYPDYPAGYTVLASAANQLGDFDLALEYLEKAKAEFPANKLIAENYIKTQKLKEKRDSLSKDDAGKSGEGITDSTKENEKEGSEPEEKPEELQSEDLPGEEEYLEEDKTQHEASSEDISREEPVEEDAGPDEITSEQVHEKTDRVVGQERSQITDDEEIRELEISNIEKINYNYTEPENLKATEIGLIPGFKISSIEASNYDANLKVKKYNEFLRSKLEAKSTEVPADNPYSKIAENIRKSKIEPEKTAPAKKIAPKNDPAAIVSETMGNIYYQQGAYKQAEDIYKKLIEKEPDKKDQFEAKIKEIRQKAKET